MSQINNLTTLPPYARLGANHGYSIDGDVAQLHADVELLATPPRAGDWALQLWACDAAHTGGPLSGVKVAEAALTHNAEALEQSRRLAAEAQARVPGGQRDYAMVLVLASGEGGQFNQVHDFANYPARQRFITPHLDGSVGYEIDDESLVLKANAIQNPRGHDNLSGSLSLELWAVTGPYRGGTVDGHALGRVDLGRLAGQSSLAAVAARVPFSPPPAGEWEVVMMLREWAGPAGYVTRDHARFAVPYVVSETTTPGPATAEAVAKQPEVESQAVVEVPMATGQATPSAAASPASVPTIVRDASPAPPAAPVGTAAVEKKASTGLARASINNASAAQLVGIKGLSRSVVGEIVKGRPYRSIEELLEVRGIGPKLLDKLRPYLTI